MGDLLSKSDGIGIGLYDEFISYLSQNNMSAGKGMVESQNYSNFLTFFNGDEWKHAAWGITCGAATIFIT